MSNNQDYDDNQFEEYEDNYSEGTPIDEGPQEDSPGGANRTFLIAAGIIGGVVVLAIIAFVVIFMLNRGQGAGRFQEQAAQINAQNTAIAMAATETASVSFQQATQKSMPPTFTPTPIIAVPTKTPQPTATQTLSPGAIDEAGRTATVAAFLTQVAQGTPAATSQTLVATTTALPTTGFADEVGLPGLFGLAVILLVIVFIARRLRFAGNN